MDQSEYKKCWNPIFAQIRIPKDDISHIKSRGELSADGEALDVFLQDYEDTVPSCELEDIKEFCENKKGKQPQQAKAWLDDRKRNPMEARKYRHRLTANEISPLLEEKRFKAPGNPDAERRLMSCDVKETRIIRMSYFYVWKTNLLAGYIADLDPDYIMVLALTVTFHQIEALRDAIWKHLALQTAIGVKIPSRGFLTFTLELHIPYLALRNSVPPISEPLEPGINSKPQRTWKDVSFLGLRGAQADPNSKFGIHEAQFSLIICGSDNFRWIAYAFVDTEFGAKFAEHDGEDDDLMNEDPIASDGEGREVIEADRPIWDARNYFIRIMDTRTVQVLKEWQYLVLTVERAVQRYQDSHSDVLSSTSGGITTEVEEAFRWTVRTINILDNLRNWCSRTVRTWERFNAPGGDQCYFSDISEMHTRSALDNVQKTFDRITDLEHRILHLIDLCKRSYQVLELRMSWESNQLNQENHNLTLRSHTLNLQTSLLNRDSHRLTKQSTETAQMTSMNARLSLTMGQFMGPVTIVLAYFSTQRDIFPFERNAKSFIVSLVVMFLAFQLLMFGTVAPWLCRWWKRMLACMGRAPREPPENSDPGPDEVELDIFSSAFTTTRQQAV